MSVVFQSKDIDMATVKGPHPLDQDLSQAAQGSVRRNEFGETSQLRSRSPLAGRKNAVAPGGMDATKIVQAFNTWAFKREQPDDSDRLLAVVEAAARAGRPVPFVLYWGKGPRHEAAAPEGECLDYLRSFGRRVEERHRPGAAITLIFTDTHAGHNGHAPEVMDGYFASVRREAEQRGFATCRLSELLPSAGDPARFADERPSPEMLESLKLSAAKWFRGEGSVEEGAVAYYAMNMVEKRAVEASFPDAVFLTFNGSDFRELFPATLPVFYMYSLRRGFSVKPWFLPAVENGA
jgi:L-tyrosine isonitrile synthase